MSDKDSANNIIFPIQPEGIEGDSLQQSAVPVGIFEYTTPHNSAPYINVKANWSLRVKNVEVNPPGLISYYAGTTAPSGWKICDGSAISRTTYSGLFTAISTTYGIGDGSTTFNIPDTGGIFIRGAGTHSTLKDAASDAFTATLAAEQNDAFQAWQLGAEEDDSGAKDYWGRSGERDRAITGPILSGYNNMQMDVSTQGSSQALKAMNDGTNGDPRQAVETRPANITFNVIISLGTGG